MTPGHASPSTADAALYAWAIEQAGAPNSGSGAAFEALRAEASHRRFFRLRLADRSLVVMDSPPELEDNPRFVALAAAFAAAGVDVPEVLAHDDRRGWLLLTDLGTVHLADAYRAGAAHAALDAAITVTLPRIEALQSALLEPYSRARFSSELDIFRDQLVRSACDLPLPDRLFEPLREHLLSVATNQPLVCVHRDYHCRNLMYRRTDSSPGSGVGVLDFQDALLGPAGYDLASLLHDCYWQFDDAVIDQYAGANRPTVDALAIQRQLKAVGIFARLRLRDNKASHLPHIVPVLQRLAPLCRRYPESRAFSHWLEDKLLPAAGAWVARA